MASRRPRPTPQPSLDLALQGGGSHGAFTWGVLDRLLEDEDLAIDGVSGTSAGALNAAVMATGMAESGREGARKALRAFWQDVGSSGGCFGEFGAPAPIAGWSLPGLAAFNLDWNPVYAWMQQWLQHASPYQFNPYDINPLRQLVERHVHEPALRRGPLALFITATAVRTGQPRIFHRSDVSHEALLASACLPQLFKAVVIDGEPYWDGGYSGNPALWPLIYETAAMDVLLIKINPLVRAATPNTTVEISDRVNEITFNAGLVSEMRAIAFVKRLLAEERLSPGRYKSLRMHMVADDEGLAPLHPSSKLNTEPRFLQTLHGLGRDAAERWLREHRRDIGVRSTLDIEASFLAPREVRPRRG